MFLGCPIGGARCGQGRRALLVVTVDGFGLLTDLPRLCYPYQSSLPATYSFKGWNYGGKAQERGEL